MPNAPFNFAGSAGTTGVVVVACPNINNFIEVLGFRLTAAGINTAEWDARTLTGNWTLFQTNYNAALATNSLPVAYKNQVTKGDLLTAYTVSVGASNACTLTDTQTNTWTQVGTTVVYNGGTFNGQMWQTVAGATGMNTVTMTPTTPGSQLQAIVVTEVIPPAGTPAADGHNQATGTSATMSTGTVSVAGTGELLCGFFNDKDFGATYAPGAGYTVGFTVNDPNFGQLLFVYNPNASAGAAVTVPITGGTPQWGCVGGSFSYSGLTTMDGPYQLIAGSVISVAQNGEQPVFSLLPGRSLVLTTTAAQVVSGGVTYAIRQVAGGNPFN